MRLAEVASLNAKVASLADKLFSGDKTIAAERKKFRLQTSPLLRLPSPVSGTPREPSSRIPEPRRPNDCCRALEGPSPAPLHVRSCISLQKT